MKSCGRSGIVALREELSEANDRIRELTNQVESLQAEIGAGKARILELLKLNCSQLIVIKILTGTFLHMSLKGDSQYIE